MAPKIHFPIPRPLPAQGRGIEIAPTPRDIRRRARWGLMKMAEVSGVSVRSIRAFEEGRTEDLEPRDRRWLSELYLKMSEVEIY